MMSDFNIAYKKIQGSEIEKWLEPLASLRIEIFKEWPYIYHGNMDYERNYLNRYAQTKSAFVSMAFVGSEIVGATTGIPLSEESHDEIVTPFLKNGFRQDEIFYFGESVLKKQFRGRGIGSDFMQHREQFARTFQNITTLSFCAVQRSDDHPLKQKDYQSLDSFWKSRGFQPQVHMRSEFSWRDLDKDHETMKTMVFWIKKIN